MPRKSDSQVLLVSPLEGLRFAKYHITSHPARADRPFAMFEQLLRSAREKNARIVAQFVFGGCEMSGHGLRELERISGGVHWPITWIQGDGASGVALTGTQAYAVAGVPVRTVKLDGRIVGSYFKDEYAEYCLLGDVLPADRRASRAAQTRSAYEQTEAALRQVGMDFSHVVRTWMYLARLLDWYDEFNGARTEFYRERGVFDRLVPASTGIGVSNPQGAALVMDAMAVRPLDSRVGIRAVASPLQCPATNYRSSFSRAVEVSLPGHRRLYVSGTASIGPDGASAHAGDVAAQVRRTMEVVEAILTERKMTWADATRAIAYFRRIEDAPAFDEYCRTKGLEKLPVALAHADICRDELLFEIEVDAAVADDGRP